MVRSCPGVLFIFVVLWFSFVFLCTFWMETDTANTRHVIVRIHSAHTLHSTNVQFQAEDNTEVKFQLNKCIHNKWTVKRNTRLNFCKQTMSLKSGRRVHHGFNQNSNFSDHVCVENGTWTYKNIEQSWGTGGVITLYFFSIFVFIFNLALFLAIVYKFFNCHALSRKQVKICWKLLKTNHWSFDRCLIKALWCRCHWLWLPTKCYQ